MSERTHVESTLWKVRITQGGAASAWFPMILGEDGPEKYLGMNGQLYELAWKQDRMREAEYKWLQRVEATDTTPDPT